jgi:hypothetical protein
MYVLAAMLVAGLICNLAVTAVDGRLFTLVFAARSGPLPASTPVVSGSRGGQTREVLNSPVVSGVPGSPKPLGGEGGSRTSGVATSGWGLVAAAWLLVSAPLTWGVFKTLALAIQMFK